MKIVILTNEFPPNVYGGAGVHVEYLTRELAKLEDGKHQVEILCFGEQDEVRGNTKVKGVQPSFNFPASDERHKKVFDPLLRNLVMAGSVKDADVVHCHTWYSHFGGCLVKQLAGAKLVLTTHSLEPHRPWKVEQLGSAYHASAWLERTAYSNADGVVAVSESMKKDVNEIYGVPFEKIKVIHNGIDLSQYRLTPNPDVLAKYKVDPSKPIALFVGRITRQKGIIHLVNAIKHLRPGTQVVLCAGAPDTKEIGEEMTALVEKARKETQNEILWIRDMLPKDEVISLYTAASVFVCPSVYEPFGIINLEAMACETAVVASAVGGIPEVVVPGETGFLVPTDPISASNVEPKDPALFSRNLADAVNAVLASPEKIQSMAKNGRKRVEEMFSWTSIAHRTLDFYKQLCSENGGAK